MPSPSSSRSWASGSAAGCSPFCTAVAWRQCSCASSRLLSSRAPFPSITPVPLSVEGERCRLHSPSGRAPLLLRLALALEVSHAGVRRHNRPGRRVERRVDLAAPVETLVGARAFLEDEAPVHLGGRR